MKFMWKLWEDTYLIFCMTGRRLKEETISPQMTMSEWINPFSFGWGSRLPANKHLSQICDAPSTTFFDWICDDSEEKPFLANWRCLNESTLFHLNEEADSPPINIYSKSAILPQRHSSIEFVKIVTTFFYSAVSIKWMLPNTIWI